MLLVYQFQFLREQNAETWLLVPPTHVPYPQLDSLQVLLTDQIRFFQGLADVHLHVP